LTPSAIGITEMGPAWAQPHAKPLPVMPAALGVTYT